MKTLTAFLLSLAPLLPVSADDSASVGLCSNEMVTEEALLQDVLTLYEALPAETAPENVARFGEQWAIDALKDATQRVRPLVEHLKTQPEQRVKAACLLAHRILCQRVWLNAVYLGEFGWLFEAPGPSGLDVVEILFTDALKYAHNEKVAPEARELCAAFVEACGGAETMSRVISWQADAMPDWSAECDAEYEAALCFYKDFCAAVSTEDEALCLQRLATLSEQLQQLCRGDKTELLRVNYLVQSFRNALNELAGYGDSPYPSPILPYACHTEARLHALQPFFEQLPALRPLVME